MWDLIVQDGLLVIPEVGQLRADIAVEDGQIAAIGFNLGEARTKVDASGAVVLPGLVDPHVHLGLEGRSFAEDVLTETASALSGGVTTIGLYLRSIDRPYGALLDQFRNDIEAQSHVDAFFCPQIFTTEQVAEISGYFDYGVAGFKLYMSENPGIVPGVGDSFVAEAMAKVGAEIEGAPVSVHCENESLVSAAMEKLRREKPEGTLADWSDSHPAEAEAEAIGRATFLASQANVTLYVVHLSSALGLRAALHARRWYDKVILETTSMYLALDKYDPNGWLSKKTPPLRSPEDRTALWEGIADGHIDTVGTDNTSRNRAAKNVDGGLHGSRGGGPLLGTHLVALLQAGHHDKGIALQRLAQVACQRPAQVFGMYPRKGTIAVGSDADLVVLDLNAERIVDAKDLHSFADFSCYEGRRMRGWPRVVIKSGSVAVENNQVLAKPGTGRYLPRTWSTS